MPNAAAYYHWPAIWIGEPPNLWLEPHRPDDRLKVLAEEVFKVQLPHGIAARVLREGRFIFDFHNWPEGRSSGRQPSSEGLEGFDAEARYNPRRRYPVARARSWRATMVHS